MGNRIRQQRGTRWIDRHVTRSTAPFHRMVAGYGADPREEVTRLADAFVNELINELGLSPWISVCRLSPWAVPVFAPDDAQARLCQSGEIRHGQATTVVYRLIRYGVPVWGARVAVTLPDGPGTLLQASFRLPVPLPEVAEAPVSGPWRPQLIEAPRLADWLGLQSAISLTSKRLVLYLLDPHAVGPTGRLVTALAGGPGPLTTRRPIGRPSRSGVFTLASEVAFDWTPPGGRKSNWLILIDANSGAVLHAERRARDVLGAMPVDEPDAAPADRRPAARPAGNVDWLDHLKAAARTATVSSGGKRAGE